jgi:hypothetical protein
MRTIDREQVAAAWAVRGFGCDLWTDPPGRRWEDFTHGLEWSLPPREKGHDWAMILRRE